MEKLVKIDNYIKANEVVKIENIKTRWTSMLNSLIDARDSIRPIYEIQKNKLDSMPIELHGSEKYKALEQYINELEIATSELEVCIFNLDSVGDDLFDN